MPRLLAAGCAAAVSLMLNNAENEIRARVHFLPDLKVGVSVTLCTSVVIMHNISHKLIIICTK
jgi:hypothetical protein